MDRPIVAPWVVIVLAVLLAVAILLAITFAVLAARARRQAREETDALRADLADLRAEVHSAQGAAVEPTVDYVITTIETPDGGHVQDRTAVPDRLVLSATLGEPLVRTLAVLHGVARALRPESRNRIRFAMRQESKRARRTRRREMRDAWREARSEDAA